MTYRSNRLVWLLFAAVLVGCEQHEQIVTYTVPTHESIQTREYLARLEGQHPPSRDERMLGAIVEVEEWMWFFKLQGLPDAIAAQEAEFRNFLKSVRFTSPEKPTWDLPANWSQLEGNEMRHATIVISRDPKLEISVTKLPALGGSGTDRLLSNINRWRGQLQLGPITAEQLPKESEAIRMGNLTATYVSIRGSFTPQPNMGGPMMGGPMASGGQAMPSQPPRQRERQERPRELKYDKPDEWKVTQTAPLATVTFEATEGDRKVTISISEARGSILANYNRWRGQVGLEPLSEQDAVEALSKFRVGERNGALARLRGIDPRDEKEKAILGLMIPDPDDGPTMFVKLMGDPELAEKERERFEIFAKSLRF